MHPHLHLKRAQQFEQQPAHVAAADQAHPLAVQPTGHLRPQVAIPRVSPAMMRRK
ncbi:MAG: hypothetical protein R2911_38705 [Caldilineaceae bacterium]